jgi:hypothetical protein
MISLLAQATATLRIVGLATVMHGSPGIDVVMPRVNDMTVQGTHIEEHTPVLMLRNEDLVSSTDTWDAVSYNDFTYVILHGEHVRFLPNATNDEAKVPAKLPRLTYQCRWGIPTERTRREAKATAAKLTTATGIPVSTVPPLISGYRPPAYLDAAAVLNIPYGETSACAAKVKEDDMSDAVQLSRIDTNVVFKTDGGITIVFEKNGVEKALYVRGESLLIVAGNIPTSFLNGNAMDSDMGHYLAYYTMLLPEGRSNCAREMTGKVDPCVDASYARLSMVDPLKIIPPPPPVDMLTPECSNSQYP